jgi:hypothetical protein
MAGENQKEEGKTTQNCARQEGAELGRNLRERDAGGAKAGRRHGIDPSVDVPGTSLVICHPMADRINLGANV